MVAWSHYSNHKSVVTGMVLAGYGLGSSIFNLIATAIINPDNKSPSIKIKQGGVTNHYFDWEIASGFPAMLRWLALIYLVCLVAGIFMMGPINANTI